MPLVRKDFITEAMEQLVDALAALAGFRKKKDTPSFEALLGKTCDDLLGIGYSTLTTFGAAQAASLLQTPSKIWLLAQLVTEHGEERRDAGDLAAAQERLTLALDLCREAKARSKTADARLDATVERVEALLATLP